LASKASKILNVFLCFTLKRRHHLSDPMSDEVMGSSARFSDSELSDLDESGLPRGHGRLPGVHDDGDPHSATMAGDPHGGYRR
jgi:hypothetical protein